jgi:hypothetical protein
MNIGRHVARVSSAAVMLVGFWAIHPASALASDSPAGFWWGIDGSGPALSGSSEPYMEPNVTGPNGQGRAGIYLGRAGLYLDMLQDSTGHACVTESNAYFTDNNASKEMANYNAGDGRGLAAYYYSGGPGADPYYDGTYSEAYTWGEEQGIDAEYMADQHPNVGPTIDTIFFDVDGTGDGWTKVFSGRCGSSNSGDVSGSGSLQRAVWDGFYYWIFNNTNYYVGVYSSSQWHTIMQSHDSVADAMEWVADWGSSKCITPAPTGWSANCNSNTPGWFGSPPSSCKVAWQWYGSSTGDYDQFDNGNLYLCA